MTDTPNIRVLQINVNRSSLATESALQIAIEYKIDLVAVQEPWLVPRQPEDQTYTDIRSVLHQAYTQIFPKSNTSSRPRTMVYVSRTTTMTINLSQDTPNDPDIQFLDLTSGSETLKFINVYNQKDQIGRRGKTIDSHLLNAQISPKVVIAGDFNLHHPLWEPDSKATPDSEALVEWIEDNELSVLNSPGEGTFYRSNMEKLTTIDLTLASHSIVHRINDWQVIKDIGSDHFGLLFTIENDRSKDDNPLQQGRFNIKKANWDKFSIELKRITSCNPKLHPRTLSEREILNGCTLKENIDTDALDLAAAELTNCIIEAAKLSIPQLKPGQRSKPWWTPELKALRKRMTWAQKNVRSTLNIKAAQENYRRTRNEYFDKIKTAKQDHWNHFLEHEDTQTIFKAMSYTKDRKVAKIPPIYTPENIYQESFKGKCEAFRKTLFPTPPTADPPCWEQYDPHVFNWPKLTECELELACSAKISGKTPGPDGISQDIITQAYNSIPNIFMNIYSLLIDIGYHPKCWKQAIGAVIKKPAKIDYSQPKSFRVISLLNCLGKVSERIIAKRLGYIAETTDLLDPTQIGGRLKKSAVDATLILTHEVEKNRQQNKLTSTLFLDIRGAFDHVAKNQLLTILKRQNMPRTLISWVKSFMENRTIQMAFDGEKEDPQSILTGIPQGSPTSPILFLIYIRDLFKTNDAHILSYMDDIAITTSSTSLAKNIRILENEASRIFSLGKRNAVQFDLSKTELMHFTKRKEAQHRDLGLPNGERVKPKEIIRWLGIWFDPGLKFRAHIHTKTSQALQCFHRMARLANVERGLSPTALRQIYLACITSITDYGSVIWWKGQDYIRESLQKLQNLALRKILGVFKTSPIQPMQIEAALMPPQIRLDTLTRKFALRLAKLSVQHPINQLMIQRTDLELPKPTQLNRIRKASCNMINRHTIEKIEHFHFPPWEAKVPYKVEINTAPKEKAAEIHKDRLSTTDWLTTTHIYTDASISDSSTGVGIAVVATNENGKIKSSKSSNIGITKHIFDGEIEAITQGMEYASNLAESGRSFVIFSDSQSALHRLAKATDNPGQSCLIRSIAAYHKLKEKQSDIILSWIPGHSNIAGNNIADQISRDASKKSANHEQSSYGWIRMQIIKKWRENWLNIQQNHNTKPSGKVSTYTKQYGITTNTKIQIPRGTKRAICSALYQLKLGHGYNKAYLHKMGRISNDKCKCGKRETVDHLLLSCKIFKTERAELKRELNGNNLNTRLLLNTRRGITKIIEFIHKTGISTRKWHLQRKEGE